MNTNVMLRSHIFFDSLMPVRLLVVSFWIVERVREIAERKSRSLERTCVGGRGGGGEERDCALSHDAAIHPGLECALGAKIQIQ